MKKDETYYFGEWRGKSMKKMKRRELYALLAEAYQLAGSFLIGAEILERDDRGSGKYIRPMNGWTQDEMDYAINTLLNFLSCPSDVTMAQFDKARQVYRPWHKPSLLDGPSGVGKTEGLRPGYPEVYKVDCSGLPNPWLPPEDEKGETVSE